ncbi:MAG: GerMN domain-containing protein [Acidobacteriota bacterium]
MNAARGFALAGVALAVLLSLSCGRRQAAPDETAATPVPTAPPMKVVLFFPGDDTLLHREDREVPELPANGASRVKFVMGELLAGSQQGAPAPFPYAATVEAAFVDNRGNAFVALSAPPPGGVQGSATEVGMVYASVHSVVANCPGIERVQLLFGGREVQTLGHLDLSGPLAPRPELVAR